MPPTWSGFKLLAASYRSGSRKVGLEVQIFIGVKMKQKSWTNHFVLKKKSTFFVKNWKKVEEKLDQIV